MHSGMQITFRDEYCLSLISVLWHWSGKVFISRLSISICSKCLFIKVMWFILISNFTLKLICHSMPIFSGYWSGFFKYRVLIVTILKFMLKLWKIFLAFEYLEKKKRNRLALIDKDTIYKTCQCEASYFITLWMYKNEIHFHIYIWEIHFFFLYLTKSNSITVI